MRFPFPCFPAEFEIPDDWWRQTGMLDFKTTETSFCCGNATDILSLRDIEPPSRLPECAGDWHGFRKAKLIAVLEGIASGADMPPVSVLILPALQDISTPLFRYRVLDGFHRFYASVAAGFEYLPVITRECCA